MAARLDFGGTPVMPQYDGWIGKRKGGEMSIFSPCGLRRLVVLGAAGALTSGVALVGALSTAPSAGAATVVVQCPTDNLQTVMNSAQPGSIIVVRGTCSGFFTIPKNLTLVGPATLDGGGAAGGLGTVLSVNPGVTASVSYFTIQHGINHEGGGIYNQGTLALNASSVSNNQSIFSGTGAGILNDGVSMTINASQVSNNESPGGGVAGIFNFTVMTINASSVSNNTASQDAGGIENIGTLNVNASRVSSNTSGAFGGGLFNRGTATFRASLVSQNTAADGGGGINNIGTVNLLASLVVHNTPDNCGSSGGPSNVPGCSG